MTDHLHPKFAHHFPGIVWNMIALPQQHTLLLEVRNHEQKQVTFSALHYVDNTFLWRDVKLEEPWWINLGASSQGVIVFTIYLDTSNPDKKGIIAYDLYNLKLLWWNNDFSLSAVEEDKVFGVSMKMGAKNIVLDLNSGTELTTSQALPSEKISNTFLKPLLYKEGTPYFDSVKRYLGAKLNLLPVIALEYLESSSHIFISYYVQDNGLTNYISVLSHAGDVLLHEKTGENLKGIGQDTFFILAGCLLFVKNKQELISYFL